MPLVQKQKFSRREEDLVLCGEYTVNVDSEGMFSAVLPQDVAQAMKDVGIHMDTNKRSEKIGWYKAESLDALKKKIHDDMDSYFHRELVSEETVLRYQIGSACSYMIDPVRGFIPNGTFCTTEDYKWITGNIQTDVTHRKPFGIQVYVEIRKKETHRFLTGQTVSKYTYVRLPYNKSVDEYSDLEWLCGAAGMGPVQGLKVEEIPATPENCKFFVETLKGLFQMNENIKHLLDPEKLQLLAKEGGTPVYLPTKTGATDNVA